MTDFWMLDAFSCAGLGAEGYRRAGLKVVCLDNDEKALQHAQDAGFHVILGDAMRLLRDPGFLAQFDAIHGSPPCQRHTAARQLAIAQGKANSKKARVDLLEPTRKLLAKSDKPWIIENVERSPIRNWPGAIRLCGSAFGLKVQRHRWFASSPGLRLTGTECDHDVFDRDPVTHKPRPWGVYYASGDNIPSGGRTALDLEHGMEVMGVDRRVPWEYLAEGLPPAFTEFLGRQLIDYLRGDEPAHDFIEEM